ncbi:acyl-CoA synthetase [Brevibacterium daeguense]|uniref:Acyl-CoA synthetase n=1 Tax=Brevibacterium daeguense TaxID=909936 RepID=A0ABP8EGF7_9MICO|nr:acyl-CoA synthetase [Brevibacterium daeguense]
MYPGKWAAAQPDKPAVIMADTGQTLSYAQLEERSLRLANHFRSLGLKPGDHVAMIAENRMEIIEAYWAALRSGTFITIVNRHLTVPESSYIIHDCDAAVVLISAVLDTAEALNEDCRDIPHRISVGGTLPGAEEYEAVLAASSAVKPDYEPRGDDMLYSSGTTGKPKGILPALKDQPLEDENIPLIQLFTALYGFDDSSVYLSPAPLYHAAPIRFVMTTHARGGTAVIMPKFDPEEALRLIEKHGVTHSQWVPTMFIRMLKLPAEVQAKYDVSSMRAAIHAAAPCPIEVKRGMIEWWGPVIHEYYAATEANGITVINSEEALAKPGSVGRDGLMGIAHICGPDGEELPTGEIGTIYFELEEGREPFVYYKDDAKTTGTRHPQHERWTTTGDLGYLDEDRYLFMSERKSFLIITGGVNIYPQEIENELALHPDVKDVAVIGEPDEELGEIVVAYLQVEDHVRPSPEFAEEVRQWLSDKLARFKIPREFRFIDEMPRTPTGKLVKRKLTEVPQATA